MKKGFSVVEYVVLFVIIISAFLVMRTHMQRGIYSMWGQAGQSFAYGRQYDPQKTIECAFDEQSKLWYDHNCYQSLSPSCNGDTTCQEKIMSGQCRSTICG
jgi:hypothetical protein